MLLNYSCRVICLLVLSYWIILILSFYCYCRFSERGRLFDVGYLTRIIFWIDSSYFSELFLLLSGSIFESFLSDFNRLFRCNILSSSDYCCYPPSISSFANPSFANSSASFKLSSKTFLTKHNFIIEKTDNNIALIMR